MAEYVRRAHRVAAIHWTGDNWADVKSFLIEYLGEDCGPYNAREDDDTGESADNQYNVAQFYAWNDDQEVDPGRWIVVFLGGDDPDGEILTADEFRMDYEPAATP